MTGKRRGRFSPTERFAADRVDSSDALATLRGHVQAFIERGVLEIMEGDKIALGLTEMAKENAGLIIRFAQIPSNAEKVASRYDYAAASNPMLNTFRALADSKLERDWVIERLIRDLVFSAWQEKVRAHGGDLLVCWVHGPVELWPDNPSPPCKSCICPLDPREEALAKEGAPQSGRPRFFCSPACRQSAHRERKKRRMLGRNMQAWS